MYLAKIGDRTSTTVDDELTNVIAGMKASGYIEVTENTNPLMTVQADGSWANDLFLQGQAIADAMQTHMDDTAKLFGFTTGMDRAGSYAGYVNDYQADALILVNWRTAWWKYAETEQQKVVDGLRTMPTVEVMFAELEAHAPTPVKA
jgi:hypothetical protein